MNPTNRTYRRKGILAANQIDTNCPWINLGLKLEDTSLPLVICSLEYDTIAVVVVGRNAADFNIWCDCQHNHAMIHEILPVLQTAFL